MHDRASPSSPMSIRLMIQVLVALFLISFGGLLLPYGGVFRRVQNVVQQQQQQAEEEEIVTTDNTLFGVVLSLKDERFQHTKGVLTSLGIAVAQKRPPSYLSEEVDVGLEHYVGSRIYHSSTFLKVWSNRMAFIEALEEFVQDSSCTRTSWRFFFEDDIALHPNVTSTRAQLLLAKGLKLADQDGFVYLGVCGPICDTEEAPTILDAKAGVEAARCAGTCAHAFGFQRWKAGEFLREMSGLTLEGVEGPVILGFYFDRYMFEYGNQVRKVWVVGSNLQSPVRMMDHVGMLYQDRERYPTTISK